MPKKLTSIKFTELEMSLICESIAETPYKGRNSKLVAAILEKLGFEFPPDEPAPPKRK